MRLLTAICVGLIIGLCLVVVFSPSDSGLTIDLVIDEISHQQIKKAAETSAPTEDISALACEAALIGINLHLDKDNPPGPHHDLNWDFDNILRIRKMCEANEGVQRQKLVEYFLLNHGRLNVLLNHHSETVLEFQGAARGWAECAKRGSSRGTGATP